MAISVKEILANGILELCEIKSLEKITIKELLIKTGVSRQTFYNHFLDKNDLIQYIYLSKIIPEYSNDSTENMNFHDCLLAALKRMKEYHNFMKQACLIDSQNCLKDYIFKHCKEFDLKWHQELYGRNEMPSALRFATEYHAMASSSMVLSWILSDMPASCEEMADLINKLRSIGMEELFKDSEIGKNPYIR